MLLIVISIFFGTLFVLFESGSFRELIVHLITLSTPETLDLGHPFTEKVP